MNHSDAVSIASGLDRGLCDPFAETDALDMCIGKSNRIVTRLIQNARTRHKRHVMGIAKDHHKAPSRACLMTGQPYSRLGCWLLYRQNGAGFNTRRF